MSSFSTRSPFSTLLNRTDGPTPGEKGPSGSNKNRGQGCVGSGSAGWNGEVDEGETANHYELTSNTHQAYLMMPGSNDATNGRPTNDHHLAHGPSKGADTMLSNLKTTVDLKQLNRGIDATLL